MIAALIVASGIIIGFVAHAKNYELYINSSTGEIILLNEDTGQFRVNTGRNRIWTKYPDPPQF